MQARFWGCCYSRPVKFYFFFTFFFVNVLACPKWCRLPETNLQVYHKNKNGPGQKYLYVNEFHWTWPTTVNVLLRGNELGKAEWKVLTSHSNQRTTSEKKYLKFTNFPLLNFDLHYLTVDSAPWWAIQQSVLTAISLFCTVKNFMQFHHFNVIGNSLPGLKTNTSVL